MTEEVLEEIMTNDEEFDDFMSDCLQYDIGCLICVIAMYYQAMWAFAETRRAVMQPELLER